MKPNLQEIRDLVQMISKIDDPHSFRLQASRLVPYMADLLEYVDKLEAVVDGAREAKQAWFTSGDYTRYMDIFHGIQKIEKSLEKLDGDG